MSFKKRKVKEPKAEKDDLFANIADADLLVDPTKLQQAVIDTTTDTNANATHQNKKQRIVDDDDLTNNNLVVSLNMNIQSTALAAPTPAANEIINVGLDDDEEKNNNKKRKMLPRGEEDNNGDQPLDTATKPKNFTMSTSVQVQTTIDYAPDICKDFKLYGYCRWGDACKFVHDRSQTKSHGQIDTEWAKFQAKKNTPKPIAHTTTDKNDDTQDNVIPAQCAICNAEIGPKCIITLCKHYFHGPCALRHHQTNKNCFTCGAETKGRFTPVHPQRD